jgi:hypothetical protein
VYFEEFFGHSLEQLLDWRAAAAAAGSSAAARALPASRPLCGVIDRKMVIKVSIQTCFGVQQARKHGNKAESRHDVSALKKHLRSCSRNISGLGK